jgi:hypothetical protein
MSELGSTRMAEADDKTVDDFEDLRVVAARIRRERDERLAALRVRLAEEPVEPDPGLKRLVDTQADFRARVMGDLAKAFF